MRSQTDDIVERYLARLDTAMRGAPSDTRHELLDDIREHIDAARSEAADDSEIEVREILDRLGPPEQIAREAWSAPASPPAVAGLLEVAAVILLLVGGVIVEVVRWSVELEGWSSAPGAAVRQARSVEIQSRNGRTTTDEIITH